MVSNARSRAGETLDSRFTGSIYSFTFAPRALTPVSRATRSEICTLTDAFVGRIAIKILRESRKRVHDARERKSCLNRRNNRDESVSILFVERILR